MSELSDQRAPGAATWVEFARYFAVSGGGFVVDLSALAFCYEVLGLPLLVANTISFSTGMIAVYLGSIFWAFERRSLRDARMEFAIFCAIGLVGLGVNHAALWAAVSLVGLPYVIGKAGAAGASFLANFILRKTALFR